MKKGDIVCGFTVLDTVHLEELNASGVWARHESGAEVFHVRNDDPENLFSFAFSTVPEDSTGVTHILEHSVLCGSQRYPLKDAFLVLAQGSLQTFLNAWTFPDKTVYPASSVNEKDYFNLMSVYADAVFHPLLSEWTFMQEAWRLAPVKTSERADAAGHANAAAEPANAAESSKPGFEYTGVVYNEMKGAYSSIDTFAGLWSIKSVMPGTPYAFESGGDPDCIPDLSWEGLKAFHRARYAPANCKIFLAGNIPTEKQLAFLDSRLKGLEPGSAAPEIPKTARWKEPVFLRIPCPGKEKPQAMISWLCADSADTAQTLALACLVEILLGHDGSPLARAMVESGLGEDISPCTGLDSELRETVFSVGLRGVTAEKGKTEEACRRVEALITGELQRLAREGIPEEEIDAALLSMEFSHREIKRSHGPFSLVWMRRSFRAWLYGTKPWDSLLFVPNFTALRRRVTEGAAPGKTYNRYFESLIEEYLLNNPHRALIAVEGEESYLAKKEEELALRLKEKEKQLSEAEKKELEEKAAALERIQGETETEEALKTIPHLTRQDLVPEVERVPSRLVLHGKTGEEGGFIIHGEAGVEGALITPGEAVTVSMVHPLFTNGISYVDMAFPVDVLEPEDYHWLPFFARAVVSLGLPGMDYGEVSSMLARTAGGFHALLETGSAAPGGASAIPDDLLARDWIIYRIKALDEKLPAALDLARNLITEADFSDLRRLRDLAVEMKNDCDSSLAPLGHNYASGRSGKFFSRSRAVDELWNGLDQIPFAHTLAAMEMGDLRDCMIRIRDALAKGGLFINITASEEAAEGALKAADRFNFGGPRAANPACRKKESFFSLLRKEYPEHHTGGAEIFSSASLQIGFAAMSLPSAPYGSPEQAAELVFSHELSTGALWESIRMMGGAYGAHAHPNNLEGVFTFSTYRDPDPLRSLGAFPAILEKRGAAGIDEDNLEKVIIGSYARETRPSSPSDKGFSEFIRSLYGITHDHRLSRLKRIIALTAEDTNAVARRLTARFAEDGTTGGCPVIIAGKQAAEKAAKELGIEVKELPV